MGRCDIYRCWSNLALERFREWDVRRNITRENPFTGRLKGDLFF